MRHWSNPLSQSLELLLHNRIPIVHSKIRSDYLYAESTRHHRGSNVLRTFSVALHRARRGTSGETLVFAALAMASDDVARWLRR